MRDTVYFWWRWWRCRLRCPIPGHYFSCRNLYRVCLVRRLQLFSTLPWR